MLMLRYSIPLIPNAFLWFFTNDASRFFIVGILGLTANGLYAVATKIPTIINVFYTVFHKLGKYLRLKSMKKIAMAISFQMYLMPTLVCRLC